MILPDVNVLVRAHRPDMPYSDKAKEWLEENLNVGTLASWDVVLTSAYRVLTQPTLVRELDMAVKAMDFLQTIRDASTVVHAGEHHFDTWRGLVAASKATGNLVTDAAIAAVCIDNGCRLATYDTDFARFPDLDWFQPPL